jgi:hypothetical protein
VDANESVHFRADHFVALTLFKEKTSLCRGAFQRGLV